LFSFNLFVVLVNLFVQVYLLFS